MKEEKWISKLLELNVEEENLPQQKDIQDEESEPDI